MFQVGLQPRRIGQHFRALVAHPVELDASSLERLLNLKQTGANGLAFRLQLRFAGLNALALSRPLH